MPPVFSRPTHYDDDEPDLAYDERKPIDKNLPPCHSVTLQEWLNIWDRLQKSGNKQGRDIFGLTGHYTDPETGHRRRAVIDLTGCSPKDTDAIYQLSDIDSVIGIVYGDLPFQPSAILKFYMILSVKHTLTADLHIPPIRIGHVDGTQESRHLHQIVNTRILEIKPEGIVRVFFPFCELPKGGVCMDEAHMSQFYDLALYPAALETLPEDLIREWPAKMADEWFRGNSRRKGADPGNGGQGGYRVQQTGRDVHADRINDWMAKVRAIIKETPELKWASNFFFGIEMRGTKNRVGSGHLPPEAPIADEEGEIDSTHPRAQAVENILEHFDTAQFESDCWYLDLATRVTISDDDDNPSVCTFPITDMHAHLLEHFSGLAWEDCVRYAQGVGGHFKKDEIAHLDAISGGRLTNPQGSATGVPYVQWYPTEKSVTYNLEVSHNAQRTDPRNLVNNFDNELESFINPLITAFSNSSQSHGIALRIECRVEFFAYPYVHLSIPEDLVRRLVYRIERHVYWGWKMARLVCMKSVMQTWIAARHRFTLDQLPESGTLLLIMVWMINALVNRPDDGHNWDQVRDTASVHQMLGADLVPARPLGAVFLPKIRFKNDKQPRVSSQRTLTIDVICKLMSTQQARVSEGDLYTLITGARQKRPREDQDEAPSGSRPAPVSRMANKQRRVTIVSSEQVEDQFSHIILPSEREEYSSEEEDPDEREENKALSMLLTQSVHNYTIQIMAKAPNRADATRGSWCDLTGHQRSNIDFHYFSSRDNLNTAFKSYVEFPADGEKWNSTVNLLFPSLDNGKKYQGISTLGARQQWVLLLQRVPAGQQERLIEHVRKYVSEHWAWLPYGGSKAHLWATGVTYPRYAIPRVSEGSENGGPWIIFNPAFDT